MNAKPGSIITFTPFPNIEPYSVLRRSPLNPIFNPYFMNYGYDKIEFFDRITMHNRWYSGGSLCLGYMYHVLVDDFGVDVPHIASAYSREFAKKDDSNEMQVLMAALRSLFHYNTCPVCWENENCTCDNPNIFV